MTALQNLYVKLESLKSLKNSLSVTIGNKGVVVAQGSKLQALVGKVADIVSNPGIASGSTLLISPSNTFSIVNLTREPTEVGIMSESIMNAIINSYSATYAIPAIAASFGNANSVTVDNCVITKTLNSTTNLWSVEFSYTAYNATAGVIPKKFWSGYQYSWVAVLSQTV